MVFAWYVPFHKYVKPIILMVGKVHGTFLVSKRLAALLLFFCRLRCHMEYFQGWKRRDIVQWLGVDH